jgi:dolichol kinase
MKYMSTILYNAYRIYFWAWAVILAYWIIRTTPCEEFLHICVGVLIGFAWAVSFNAVRNALEDVDFDHSLRELERNRRMMNRVYFYGAQIIAFR